MSPSKKVHNNMRCVLGLFTLLLTLVAFGPSTALASGVWSAPTAIESGGSFYSASCSSATFCVAFGDPGSGGPNVATYNGRSWSAPTKIGGYLYITHSMSCPSATFCVAAAGGDYNAFGVYNANGVNALTYNGRSWSATTHVVGFLSSVSCPSARFCVALGGPRSGQITDALTYNGTSWSSPTQIISLPSCGVGCSAGGLGPVSCSSPTFCVAIALGVYKAYSVSALTYNGTSWSAPTLINGTGNTFPNSLSCPSATFCAAVAETGGDALTYNGTSWTAPTQIDGDSGGEGAVSCPSATFCVAVDSNGNALTYNGTSWTAPTKIHGVGGFLGVSCPSVTFCGAAGFGGQGEIALTYTTATAGEGSASVKIEKFKVTTSSLLVTIKTSRAGTATITGPGLKKTVKQLAAGTNHVTLVLTKAGTAERKKRKNIKLSVSLKTSTKTVSASRVIKL